VLINPDKLIFWQYKIFAINETLVSTWVVMLLLSLGSWLITRGITSEGKISRRQSVLEAIVSGIDRQLKELTPCQPKGLLPFVGTLFLFIAVSNTLSVIPGVDPPTGSLSTTAALALCVFLAVPVYGIARAGLFSYLLNYVRPSFFMLPFNIMGEISRTLALAVRLFGNVMSGNMIGAMLLMIAPVFSPVIMQILGLLTGIVQAYIFAILAAVYIGAGMEIQSKPKKREEEKSYE
jgi:F-type H+-transporting ATPase subunit a